MVAAEGDTDDYCNFAILSFAKITNLLNHQVEKSFDEEAGAKHAIQVSWDELQEWRRWRPQQVKPLLRVESLDKHPFPTVIYARSSSSRSPSGLESAALF